ncbi:hypothetical protein [Stigmatella aurantiaca]|uniref:Conserved uncharacterized protein n=1 Tax=Stigmatella aurantiaca (strain DW4/3-1) TaxID=378806 RepID=Q092R2_STIAD|nr:hypothetical protein [Stigmatella aurantiaca]ADO70729.1 conserved uncharacterized protein [Stigmatella aurantiaca DW4/3-1]EAU66685.1 conserved hypothetical protein [Stigmatella aurantiaca DW4/3-1]
MSSIRSSIFEPLAVEVHIRQEKASSLRRTGENLEKLITELGQIEIELRTLSGPPRAGRVKFYQQMRADAEYQRWCLVVQREAMGLWNHSEVDLMYRIPPAVKQ